MRTRARPYVAGALILWACALQAHVWSIPDEDLRRLRGASDASDAVRGTARGTRDAVHAHRARRDDADDARAREDARA